MIRFLKLKGIKEKLPKKELKILFVASEAAPFAKAGGLGEIMFSLPLALKKLGQDVRVMIPYYGNIDKKYKLEKKQKDLKIPTDNPKNPYLICDLKQYHNGVGVLTYFLDNPEYYGKRTNIYGYSDDPIRWILFCRGVLEFIKKSQWIPNLIVSCDWQTGLLPNYLKTIYRKEPTLSPIKTVFSIHNLHFQGMCDFKFLPQAEQDSGQEPIPDFFNPRLSKLNWLKRGILYSDIITTVSPTYAQEIQTPEYGEGLENLLKEKRDRLFGILNGIDYSVYNPKETPHLPVQFNSLMLDKRKENKLYLQDRFALPQDENVFLIGMASRLEEQKGFDLIEKIMKNLLKYLSFQFILIGDGESRYKEFIKELAEKYPKRIGYNFEFDPVLPHLLFGGSDAFLIPSKFEPCGLTQMEAARYGSVPLVRKTGGLADTIEDFSPEKDKGIGFVFEEYKPLALFTAIVRACNSFRFKNHWKRLIKRAMEKDFSWERSAKEYLSVFWHLNSYSS
ncbi:MAG: glycogen/starch synthase [Patescibacteria group bacterium]|nr:glycogen/starch synthase [Patescibacteria group bacterium]